MVTGGDDPHPPPFRSLTCVCPFEMSRLSLIRRLILKRIQPISFY
jgi:hypothetical protein